jgi:hypothetical protein
MAAPTRTVLQSAGLQKRCESDKRGMPCRQYMGAHAQRLHSGKRSRGFAQWRFRQRPIACERRYGGSRTRRGLAPGGVEDQSIQHRRQDPPKLARIARTAFLPAGRHPILGR